MTTHSMDSSSLHYQAGMHPDGLSVHSPSIADSISGSISGYDSTSMDYMDMSGGAGVGVSCLDTDSAFSDTMSLPSSGSHISVTTTSSQHSGSSNGSGGSVHSPTPVGWEPLWTSIWRFKVIRGCMFLHGLYILYMEGSHLCYIIYFNNSYKIHIFV